MRESNEGDGKWVCVWGRGGECILVGKRTASNETTKDTIIKSRGIVWKKGRWKSEVEILFGVRVCIRECYRSSLAAH